MPIPPVIILLIIKKIETLMIFLILRIIEAKFNIGLNRLAGITTGNSIIFRFDNFPDIIKHFYARYPSKL